MADEICKFFCRLLCKYSVKDDSRPRKRRYYHVPSLSASEIITILIMFHGSGYRSLKHFYPHEICEHRSRLYGRLVSYNRFVELENIAQVEHSRRRIFHNFFAYLMA